MTEEILIKLNTIASLEKGQTLSTLYEKPVFHNSWSTSFTRTYNGEHRKKTINYIQNVIEEACNILEDLKIKDKANYDVLTELIKKALLGIDNLKNTYKTDYYIIGLINAMIENTNNRLNNISKVLDNEYETLDHQLFFDAIKNRNDLALENILSEKGSNIKNNKLQNGLHIVVDKNYYNVKILNKLFDYNVDVFAKDIDGNTPLYYAVSNNNTEAVIELEKYISKKKRK